jgi:hypothetical protein
LHLRHRIIVLRRQVGSPPTRSVGAAAGCDFLITFPLALEVAMNGRLDVLLLCSVFFVLLLDGNKFHKNNCL